MQTPITALPGVGEKKAAAFHKLGIQTFGAGENRCGKLLDVAVFVVELACRVQMFPFAILIQQLYIFGKRLSRNCCKMNAILIHSKMREFDAIIAH